MKEFIYDNTFEGLLTAIFYAYPHKEECTITRASNYIPNFLNDICEVKTEEDKFNRVYKSINDKLNSKILKNIYYLYLSDAEEADSLSLEYLRLCYKYGTDINLAKNNDIIITVDKYCRRVSLEAHRFTGFVRFKEIAPLTFYSSIEPDHNILPIILKHFTKRFSDQNFIIHDTKRELAIIYNKETSIITDLTNEEASILTSSNDDSNFESLWKTFYESVNIKERENLRLRDRSMPRRYWKNLIEI